MQFAWTGFHDKVECQWNYKQNHMVMKCVPTSEVDQGCLVDSLEDEVIPPKNEAVRKSNMISGAKTKEGVLVPFKMFIHMHGLAVAHALVKSEDGVIYVRVFNPGNHEVCVKRDTEIGVLAPVGDVIESLLHEDVTVCDIKTGTGSVELPEFLCEKYRGGCEHLSTEQNRTSR